MKFSKNVLYTGYYGFKNFGDDLFPIACIQGHISADLKYEAIILSPPIQSVNAKFLVPRFLGNSYRSEGIIGKVLRLIFMIYGAIRCRDVVLAGGSTIASDSSLKMRYIQYLLAKIGLCRLSAIGVSVGPFVNTKDLVFAGKLMSVFRYLSVRDRRSLDEFSKLNSVIVPHLHNDLAGCVSLPTVVTRRKEVLGVSICNYESYIGGDLLLEKKRNEAIFEGVREYALKHKCMVKVLALNANQSIGDIDVSKRFAGRLVEAGVPVETIIHTDPMITLNEISECGLFLSIRLHGAIAAYLMEIPFVLVEYHRKCTDFLDYIGVDINHRADENALAGVNIFERLQNIYEHGLVCAVTPDKYRQNSMNIFRQSPWST